MDHEVSMTDIWRWGVAGPGAIAARFADAMAMVPEGTIHAVASRSAERADAYGDRHGIAVRHVGYEALANDPAVDIVYVATLPAHHEQHVRLFLDAGKHVLCEKPFALDFQQARLMADLARRNGVFLMEAMWSRFLPAWTTLVKVLEEGRIGEVRMVEASLGFPFPPESRVFDRATGGGALLDLGVYALNLCSVVLGHPEVISAAGALSDGGVDEHSGVLLRNAGGAIGLAASSITSALPNTAQISGTRGSIELPAFFHCPDLLNVTTEGRREQIDCSFEGDGMRFELDDVHRSLAAGRTESLVMPLDETLSMMSTLDAVRTHLGGGHR